MNLTYQLLAYTVDITLIGNDIREIARYADVLLNT